MEIGLPNRNNLLASRNLINVGDGVGYKFYVNCMGLNRADIQQSADYSPFA